NRTIRALIELLARPANEQQGVLNVLSDLVKIGWPFKPNVEAYEALFTAIFATFRKVQPDRDLEFIANIIFTAVQEFIRNRFIRQFCESLLQSTSLKP